MKGLSVRHSNTYIRLLNWVFSYNSTTFSSQFISLLLPRLLIIYIGIFISDTTFILYLCLHSVLVSVSCPKTLYHLESDNIFRIAVVVADWLG